MCFNVCVHGVVCVCLCISIDVGRMAGYCTGIQVRLEAASKSLVVTCEVETSLFDRGQFQGAEVNVVTKRYVMLSGFPTTTGSALSELEIENAVTVVSILQDPTVEFLWELECEGHRQGGCSQEQLCVHGKAGGGGELAQPAETHSHRGAVSHQR